MTLTLQRYHKPFFVGFLLLFCAIVKASDVHAQTYWNQFRGPNGDGKVDERNIPTEFSENSDAILWKTAVPGRAWSSPVVWNKQVWVTNGPEVQNPEGLSDFDVFPKDPLPPPADPPIRLSAVCLDLDSGEILKDITVFEISHPQFIHLTNSYASSTPVIEEGKIYVHYGSHGTACLDTQSGEKLWERTDLQCHHFRGAGSSPILYKDLLILCFDGFDKQFIVALNKNTGETVWSKDRDIEFENDNGDYRKAYATPIVIDVEGQALLISPHANATSAYVPETGELQWRVFHGGMNAAARPVFGKGVVLINAGDGKEALVAIDPKGKGADVSQTHIRWRTGRMSPKRPSQLFDGDYFFLLEDKGVIACMDPETGEILGQNRVSGNYWASPILVGDKIYICSQEGKVTAFKADLNLDVIGSSNLDEGIIASPAVANDSLLIRTKTHLYRIGKDD